MPDEFPSPVSRPAWRRLATVLARLIPFGLAGLIAAGFAGQVVRDRSVAAALLMYIPLVPVGVVAVVVDLASRGRSIPRFRFGLTALGAAVAGWSAYTMLGWEFVDKPEPGDSEISVLHWNTLWGGLFPDERSAAAQRAAIVNAAPDIVVLSEAPKSKWLRRLAGELGPGAGWVGFQYDSTSTYWYHLAVCSRWPIEVEERLRLPCGSAMSVMAEVRGRRLRLLVVDGISSPRWSRLPFLRAIAAACRKADTAGRPYDLVLGDFNTPSRSLGFDELESLGYRLAGRSARGWRGTFPSWVPVYDIDHVWLDRRLRIAGCAFFNGPSSDHRGQVVRVLLPKEDLP